MTEQQLQALKDPGGKKRKDWSAVERAVLEFTDRLTTFPGGITESELQELSKHFNETQIVELVLTIAAANFTNRVNEGALTPVDV